MFREVEDLQIHIHHLAEMEILNKIDHSVHQGVDYSAVGANDGKPEPNALPKILIAYLRNGEMKAAPHAFDRLSDDLPLSLQRMVVLQK
jgi:hypothetical protein